MVESNVHFPTDYNLLWDSARKCLDMAEKFSFAEPFGVLEKYFWIPEWRKMSDWITEGKQYPNVELGKMLLEEYVEKVVMPQKGKRNKQEEEEENQRQFKLLRNKHSAVESNINELEHRGLDRCPDRGHGHFKRYVGLAVSAYNLRRIGQELIAIRRKQELAEKELRTAA